jgi:hypothetical protein
VITTAEDIARTVSKIKGDTEICIRTPLALYVSGTLMALIASAYPSARIATNRSNLTILISNGERARKLSKRDIKNSLQTSENPTDEAVLNGFKEQDDALVAEFGLPIASGHRLANFCHDMLTMEGATNYVEFEARDKDNMTFWVAACRSEQQTPHKLRMKAEAKLEVIKKLHESIGIYDECGHAHTDEEAGDPNSGVLYVDEIGNSCKEGLMYFICKSCCWREDYGQTEECACEHAHGMDKPICETRALLELENRELS